VIDYDSLRTGAGIFDVLSKAKALEREGKKILHFEIGQPGGRLINLLKL